MFARRYAVVGLASYHSIFVVVNATTTIATKAMADFVLTKPVPQSHLRGFLDIAVGWMEREHRRYFRHKASVPLQLFCNTGVSFAGKIKNVSEGGLAVTHFGPTAAQGVVTVQFELPVHSHKPSIHSQRSVGPR
jgi:hypothetical protein